MHCIRLHRISRCSFFHPQWFGGNHFSFHQKIKQIPKDGRVAFAKVFSYRVTWFEIFELLDAHFITLNDCLFSFHRKWWWSWGVPLMAIGPGERREWINVPCDVYLKYCILICLPKSIRWRLYFIDLLIGLFLHLSLFPVGQTLSLQPMDATISLFLVVSYFRYSHFPFIAPFNYFSFVIVHSCHIGWINHSYVHGTLLLGMQRGTNGATIYHWHIHIIRITWTVWVVEMTR